MTFHGAGIMAWHTTGKKNTGPANVDGLFYYCTSTTEDTREGHAAFYFSRNAQEHTTVLAVHYQQTQIYVYYLQS